MPWFLTAYPVTCELPGIVHADNYAGSIWALDHAGAVDTARRRRAGEVIISGPMHSGIHGNPLVSVMIRGRRAKWPRIIHATCFLSHFALKAEVVVPEQITGDGGLLHGTIHAMTRAYDRGKSRQIRERLAKLAEEIEGLVPGWAER